MNTATSSVAPKTFTEASSQSEEPPLEIPDFIKTVFVHNSFDPFQAKTFKYYLNSEKLVLITPDGTTHSELLDELCLNLRTHVEGVIAQNPGSHLNFLVVLAKLANDNPNVLVIAKVKDLFSQQSPYPSSLSFTCIRDTDHFLLQNFQPSFSAVIIVDEKGRLESSVIKDNKFLFSYLKNVVVQEKAKAEEQTGYILTEFDTSDRMESLQQVLTFLCNLKQFLNLDFLQVKVIHLSTFESEKREWPLPIDFKSQSLD